MKLGLGTVQFGMDYGVSNSVGQTDAATAKEILSVAQVAGMTVLDTATAYGASESIIGDILLGKDHKFRIVTKISSQEQDPEHVFAHAIDSLQRSLERLRQDKVYAVLIHNAVDLLKPGGAKLFKALQAMKEQELVQKIGVSIYTGDQIDSLLQNYQFDLIQLPFNVFDQRLLQSGHLHKLKSLNIEIHARSIFLQGLLLMTSSELPPYFHQYRQHITDYQQAVQRQNLSLPEAALGFALQQTTIDTIVLGVNDARQLRQLLAIANEVPSKETLVPLDKFACDDSDLINPSIWPVDKRSQSTVRK